MATAVLLSMLAASVTCPPAHSFDPDLVGTRSNEVVSLPTSRSAFVDRDLVSAGELATQAAGGLIGGGLMVVAGWFMLDPCHRAWEDLWTSRYQGVRYYVGVDDTKTWQNSLMIIIPSLAVPAAVTGGVAFAGRDWTTYDTGIAWSFATAVAGGAAGYGIGRLIGGPGRALAIGYCAGSLAGGLVGYNWDRLR